MKEYNEENSERYSSVRMIYFFFSAEANFLDSLNVKQELKSNRSTMLNIEVVCFPVQYSLKAGPHLSQRRDLSFAGASRQVHLTSIQVPGLLL